MADTLTNNLQLTKPEIGGSQDTWGTKFNSNLDAIDAVFAANGGGTGIGLNIGAGKTFTMAGSASFTGSTTISGPFTFGPGAQVSSHVEAVVPWIRSTEVTSTPGLSTIPRASNGNWQFGQGIPVRGTWDASGFGTFGVNNLGNFLPRPTEAIEVNHVSLVSGIDHGGLLFNSVWKSDGPNGASHYRTQNMRSWGLMFDANYCNIGCSPASGDVDTEVFWRWAFAVDTNGGTYSYVGWGASDLRQKSHLLPILNATEKTQALAGYTYRMERTGDERHAGVIAQDLQQVLPEAVREKDGLLVINTAGVVALLVEAVKELSARLKAGGL